MRIFGWMSIVLLVCSVGMTGCAGGTVLLPTPSIEHRPIITRIQPTITLQVNPPTPTGLVVPQIPTASPTIEPILAPSPTPTETPEPGVSFAVIGDYGEAGEALAEVAALINSWQPDFILTTGDNNYPIGAAETIDTNIGQYFSDYIADYKGDYGPGAEVNRFFPVLGNHDWITDDAKPYLDYFTLPGNERYYDFTWGPVHVFALDSDSNEPDGVGRSSVQAAWLQATLAQSQLPWQIIVMHHPPYSSGYWGAVDWTRWPYAEWGADAVMSGHDHTYERLSVDGIPYFVNGMGGGAIYYFDVIDPHSLVRYNNNYGAMLVTATKETIEFYFYNRLGELIDTYRIEQAS